MPRGAESPLWVIYVVFVRCTNRWYTSLIGHTTRHKDFPASYVPPLHFSGERQRALHLLHAFIASEWPKKVKNIKYSVQGSKSVKKYRYRQKKTNYKKIL